MSAPDDMPKMAYLVVDDDSNVCFSAPTFERAMERIAALLKSQLDSTKDIWSSYHVSCVEAE